MTKPIGDSFSKILCRSRNLRCASRFCALRRRYRASVCIRERFDFLTTSPGLTEVLGFVLEEINVVSFVLVGAFI